MPNLWTAFAAVADARPNAPALVTEQDGVSFGDLKHLAERCASHLAGRGVGRGDLVGLQLPKRLESYALLLACLRLGAPYVFLDPKNPADRTRRMLDRVRPRLLFGPADTANPYGDAISFPRDAGREFLPCLPACEGAAAPVTGSDPAYVMFTSGSTGEPKGAVIPHQGVLSLMRWARHRVLRNAAERFTNINPLHFDNSVFDIYCGLLNGAALVPIETGEQSNPARWVRTIRSAEVTVMFAVPTLFLMLDQLGLLTPASLPTVRTFMFGGEGYPIGRLRDFHARFGHNARLINVYGPTETSCICTSIEIDENALAADANSFPPLGRMHDDFSYAILDDERRPVRRGEGGELWIGGPCVGLGYYGNPDETVGRFRQDPRHAYYRSIFYRSGDLVCEDDAGRLWFQGRADNQVKVRGYRIELEEIDLAVQSVPGVRRAVAVLLTAAGDPELNVAYMADRRVSADEVHAACRDKLPAYMRPARAVQLDRLPQNANGKVDRLATKSLLASMISPQPAGAPLSLLNEKRYGMD
jgi:D-alanine--poly(phosphoribitol) ligase subunit 1